MADVICTKKRPWNRVQRPPRGEGKIRHPDAVAIRDRALKGVDMECPHCGVKFTSHD